MPQADSFGGHRQAMLGCWKLMEVVHIQRHGCIQDAVGASLPGHVPHPHWQIFNWNHLESYCTGKKSSKSIFMEETPNSQPFTRTSSARTLTTWRLLCHLPKRNARIILGTALTVSMTTSLSTNCHGHLWFLRICHSPQCVKIRFKISCTFKATSSSQVSIYKAPTLSGSVSLQLRCWMRLTHVCASLVMGFIWHLRLSYWGGSEVEGLNNPNELAKEAAKRKECYPWRTAAESHKWPFSKIKIYE